MDFKAGGQNEAVGKDPVILNRVDTILPLLYTGGYSAVLDASKFFYKFETRTEDQPYLGVIHPITREHYCYGGLPMGGANCPAIAGRVGAAFMRLIRARHQEISHGQSASNTWRDGFHYKEFDPKLGQGFVWRLARSPNVGPRPRLRHSQPDMGQDCGCSYGCHGPSS